MDYIPKYDNKRFNQKISKNLKKKKNFILKKLVKS
jgi:hypothetical protein